MATFTNQTKHTSSFTNQAKNVASFTNLAISAAKGIKVGDLKNSVVATIKFTDVMLADGTTMGNLTFNTLISGQLVQAFLNSLWTNQTKH